MKILLPLILCATLTLIRSASASASADSNDEAYFRQFLYHSVDLNNDPDFPARYRYYSLANDFPFEIPLGDAGKLIIMFNLYLNPDGTFDSWYTDGIEPKGSNTWPIRHCLITHGTWSVPDKEMEVRDEQGRLIYTGSRAVVYGQNAVKLHFTADFQIAELRGTEKAFVSSQSDSPKADRCFP